MAVLEDITCKRLRPLSRCLPLLTLSPPPHCLIRSLAPLMHFTQTALSAPMAGAVDVLKQYAETGALSGSDWLAVATAGKTLADSLRSGPSAGSSSRADGPADSIGNTFSEELRSAVGGEGVLDACGALLRRLVTWRQEQQAVAENVENSHLGAQTELVRVVGNLCFDHGKAGR